MSEPMDPDRLRRLFAEAEAKLTLVAPPLATITARAARRRSRRLAVVWASGITAAAAVTVVVLAVNLVGVRSAPDSSPPAPAVASSPSAVGSASPVPTPESAPASGPGSSPSAGAPPPVASPPAAPAPAAPGMRWVSQDFGSDEPSLRLQVPASWTSHHAFVGQTGGAEWVNPADPDQRVAAVIGGCMSCQQPELTRDPTVRTWLVDSTGVLIQPGDATIRWTSVTVDGQQGFFTDTSHIDDFCLNGSLDNPAQGKTHEPYVALGYVHLAQQPIVEPVEVFAWAPTGIAQAVVGSVTYAPPAYVTYWNARFKYQLDVPASLTAGTPPTNGDGRSFTSSDGQATLLVAGENNVTGDTPSSVLAGVKQGLADAGKTVTHTSVSGPVVVISGTYEDQGRAMVFYYRTAIGAGSEDTMQWTYPASQRDIYDPQVAHTAATFIAGDLDHVH